MKLVTTQLENTQVVKLVSVGAKKQEKNQLELKKLFPFFSRCASDVWYAPKKKKKEKNGFMWFNFPTSGLRLHDGVGCIYFSMAAGAKSLRISAALFLPGSWRRKQTEAFFSSLWWKRFWRYYNNPILKSESVSDPVAQTKRCFNSSNHEVFDAHSANQLVYSSWWMHETDRSSSLFFLH